MTPSELKFGPRAGLEGINKSLKRLRSIENRNWSQRDTKPEIIRSPSNFGANYRATANSEMNSFYFA